MRFRKNLAALITVAAVSSAAMVPTVHAAVFVDPAGDVFGVGAIRPDIVSMTGGIVATNVQFTVNFAGAVAAASAFAPNSIVGFVDLDVDQNAATGGTAPWGGPVVGGNSWLNFFIPPNPGGPPAPPPLIGLGDEYFIDISSELFHPGLVDVVRTLDSVTILVPIAFGPTSFSVTVPLALLGGDDGRINFGALVGTFTEPTDRAPNGAAPASTVPEPASLALVASALVGVLGFRRRRSA